jgi:hypothetical protein
MPTLKPEKFKLGHHPFFWGARLDVTGWVWISKFLVRTESYVSQDERETWGTRPPGGVEERT